MAGARAAPLARIEVAHQPVDVDIGRVRVAAFRIVVELCFGLFAHPPRLVAAAGRLIRRAGRARKGVSEPAD
ncbi:MAG: hypothetical protein FJ191_12120 [Gammaproteobacteria bacterium]|nr:hypothetical protein [Gammaproteobacteria bacterium]